MTDAEVMQFNYYLKQYIDQPDRTGVSCLPYHDCDTCVMCDTSLEGVRCFANAPRRGESHSWGRDWILIQLGADPYNV